MGAAEKEANRALVLRGGPWVDSERRDILEYCEADVLGCAKVLRRLADGIDGPRALLRGRYVWSVATMERIGVPIDVELLTTIRARWNSIRLDLIETMDAKYHVYDHGHFRADLFATYLSRTGVPWPQLISGRLDLSAEAFTEAARMFPELTGLKELRASLSALRINELAVGRDGRNRTMLSPFRAKTGRNGPSSSKFVFGPAKWIRHLIKPEPGRALAYIDFRQQEFAIAGVLSGDSNMTAAYVTADPYLAFARMAGAVPIDATEESHEAERDRYKASALGVQYGQGAHGLAARLGIGVAGGAALLEQHRQTFPAFWRWSDAVVDFAMLVGELRTDFGWRIQAGRDANPRSMRNFLMQATGADILRVACILAEEAGVRVCAPIHDALLIEASAEEIHNAVEATVAAMERASRVVLGGFALKTKVTVIPAGERFREKRGAEMWTTVCRLIGWSRP